MFPQPNLCRDCGSALDRGTSAQHTGATRCMVCLVARAMRTFVWPPKRAR